MLKRVHHYLTHLTTGRLILWCYFLWYLVVLVRYFDPSPRIWFTALGLSLIIGTALTINATRSGSARLRLERWPTIRMFLFPFCVSSFSSLVKGRDFILIFSRNGGELASGATLCAALCLATFLVKRFAVKPLPSRM